MDTRTEPGDIFILDENTTLVYGGFGIALRLSKRNHIALERVYKTLECVKDIDSKDRRFTVAYRGDCNDFRFDLASGEQVNVPAWEFGFDAQKKAA